MIRRLMKMGVTGGVVNIDYSAIVLATKPDNLLALWKHDELSGTAEVDSSGNGYNGLYKNSPILAQPGMKIGSKRDTGKSVLFNGTNNWVNHDIAGLANAFNGQEGSVLVCICLDPSILNDNAAHSVISFSSVTTGNGFSIQKGTANTLLMSYAANGISRFGTINPPTSNWIILGMRWSYINNQARFTVNGIPTTEAFPGGIGLWDGILNHDKMFIGSSTSVPSAPYKGYIDTVALWDIFLSDGEMYTLGTMGIPDNTLHPRFTRVSTKSLYRDATTADWLGRPVLCNNDGEWIMVYRQSIDHATANADVRFHIRFSADEGVNWSAADTLVNTTAVTGAPFAPHATNTNMTDGIIFRAPNGDLLFHVFEKPGNVGTFQYRSTDDGATWSDEGKINNDSGFIGGQDHFIIGTDIYITVMDSASDNGSHPYVDMLYKSADNGANWVKVSDITTGTDDSELSIINTGGNNLICIMKDITFAKTFKYTSSDLGAHWGAQIDITSQVGVLQRPRIRAFGSVLLLYGRDYVTSTKFYTVVYVSTDGGETFGEKFYPDTGNYQDGGYSDILQRTDGSYYMLSYGGLITVADIKEYIWS